jgi:hypothetical protein
MKPNKSRYLIAGVLLFALQILVSCSGDNGTSPPAKNQDLTLSISGTLTPTEMFVSPDSVRVLFDGKEVTVKLCPDIFACDKLDITVITPATRGPHSVEFELLVQLCGTYPFFSCNGGQKYKVSGNVTVSNSSGVIQQIDLDKQTVTLDTGDKVKWQIEVN